MLLLFLATGLKRNGSCTHILALTSSTCAPLLVSFEEKSRTIQQSQESRPDHAIPDQRADRNVAQGTRMDDK
ncbi:hypothetical protein Mapa_006694 [Marchantia paleacea]|nr:hypothetical protein Mapa_006694 [Marchantia paleacea]